MIARLHDNAACTAVAPFAQCLQPVNKNFAVTNTIRKVHLSQLDSHMSDATAGEGGERTFGLGG
jgi:hypothetical protein